MNFTARDQAFVRRWQQLQIREKAETSTPASRCDALRSLSAQVEFARAANMMNAQAASILESRFAESYSSIVDVPVEEGGVDNYAENALTLTTGRKNESKAWSTSLNKDNVMQLDCVKAFLQDSKLARGMQFPDGKENETLPSKHRKPTEQQRQISFTSNNNNISKPEVEKVSKTATQPLFKPQNFNSNPTKPNPDPPTVRKYGDISGLKLSSNLMPSGTESSGQSAGSRADNFNSLRDRFFDQWGGANRQGGPDRSAPYPPQPPIFNRAQSATNPTAPKPYAQFAPDKPVPPYKKPVKRPCRDIEDEPNEGPPPAARAFKTAGEQLAINNQKKYSGGRGGLGAGGAQSSSAGGGVSSTAYGSQKRSLGTRRGLNSKFVPPVMRDDNDDGMTSSRKPGAGKTDSGSEELVDERLKNIEPKMIELITSEIMDNGPEIAWSDIAGLEFAKKTIKEIVVWPMLRPDIFTGLRGPPKGLLLFGPPGTGKTLIGKCIASQSKSTFFSISASSLTSKWVGEGEKMVRALFAVARVHQPAVIFMDEIDSLLSQRSDGENEGSRRIKTEFLVQLDGATTGSEERILVVGATNRPQEIDEAARRRFVKRLYIPLPETPARRQIVVNLMQTQVNDVSEAEIDEICKNSGGYSGADMANLCREAALGPIRSVPFEEIENIAADQVRPITYADFQEALEHVRPSVSEKDLDAYLDWNRQFGSWGK